MSDALYKSPSDSMIKMMVDHGVPTFSYVLNTSINALNYPFWSRVPHNIEYFFLTGAPFMDPGINRSNLNDAWSKLSKFFLYLQISFLKISE